MKGLMPFRLLAGLMLASFLALGCSDGEEPLATRDAGRLETGGGLGLDSGDPDDFWTFAVLPDTQTSYSFVPPFFEVETRWLAENAAAERIAFVLHEGDIVNTPKEKTEWAMARASMGWLDGIVPYVLAVGNHDLDVNGPEPRATLINQYFLYEDFSRAPTFGGAFESGHLENTFSLLPGGGRTWLVLSLEFSPRPAVIAWADQVLSAHADLPAILLTHAYLYSDGKRYDYTGRKCQFFGDCTNPDPPDSNPQCWNPICYLSDGSDGETLWNSLVLPHSNVLFVFSGHVANPSPFNAARLSSQRPDGTICHQIMANYQGDAAAGADGYIRLLRIWPGGRVQVMTYSPYADPANAFLTEDRNQFELQIQIPGG
jgi:hypothetical protein